MWSSQRVLFLCYLGCFFLLLIFTGETIGETISKSPAAESRALRPDAGRSLILGTLLLAPIGIGLLIFAAILAFLPVPVISLGRRMEEAGGFNLVQKMMSEECMERLACEVANLTYKYPATSRFSREIETYINNTRSSKKLRRIHRAPGSCMHFNCDPINSVSRFMKNFAS